MRRIRKRTFLPRGIIGRHRSEHPRCLPERGNSFVSCHDCRPDAGLFKRSAYVGSCEDQPDDGCSDQLDKTARTIRLATASDDPLAQKLYKRSLHHCVLIFTLASYIAPSPPSPRALPSNCLRSYPIHAKPIVPTMDSDMTSSSVSQSTGLKIRLPARKDWPSNQPRKIAGGSRVQRAMQARSQPSAEQVRDFHTIFQA